MSAYLVSKSHIDALVALVATERKAKGCPMTYGEMGAIGAMLIRANVRSIEGRYPDTIGNPDRAPGPNVDNPERAFADSYTWAPVKATITPVGALVLLQCYEYQSSEVDDFEESSAGILCRYLKLWIISRHFPGHQGPISGLPGYDAAPWGL